jgi:hypothetical protein
LPPGGREGWPPRGHPCSGAIRAAASSFFAVDLRELQVERAERVADRGGDHDARQPLLVRNAMYRGACSVRGRPDHVLVRTSLNVGRNVGETLNTTQKTRNKHAER